MPEDDNNDLYFVPPSDSNAWISGYGLSADPAAISSAQVVFGGPAAPGIPTDPPGWIFGGPGPVIGDNDNWVAGSLIPNNSSTSTIHTGQLDPHPKNPTPQNPHFLVRITPTPLRVIPGGKAIFTVHLRGQPGADGQWLVGLVLIPSGSQYQIQPNSRQDVTMTTTKVTVTIDLPIDIQLGSYPVYVWVQRLFGLSQTAVGAMGIIEVVPIPRPPTGTQAGVS